MQNVRYSKICKIFKVQLLVKILNEWNNFLSGFYFLNYLRKNTKSRRYWQTIDRKFFNSSRWVLYEPQSHRPSHLDILYEEKEKNKNIFLPTRKKVLMCYLPTPERVFDLSCVFLATDLGRVQQREQRCGLSPIRLRFFPTFILARVNG